MCTHGKLWQSNLIKNNHRYLHQQQKQSSVETVAYWKVPLLPASVTQKHLLLWKRVVFMAITNISKSFEYYLTNSISNYIDNILSFPFEPGIGFTDFPFAFLFLTCRNWTTVFHEKRVFTAPNEVRWFQAYGKLAHLSLHIPYNIVVSMHNSVPSANKRVVRWRKFAPPSFTGNWIPWRPMKRRWFHICILFFLEMINNSVRLKQPSFP